VEIRARGAEGSAVPWDGQSMGELEVRGPWIASSYYDSPESADRWTDDGWFRTGDIVTIDARGCIEIADRTKDVIKSGGEWISSVALENSLMAHPAVAESAVIAVPDEKWAERPLAVVVLKEGATATADELRDHLGREFAKWWLPERIEFVAEIPKTAVGKFKKTALREMFAGDATGAAPEVEYFRRVRETVPAFNLPQDRGVFYGQLLELALPETVFRPVEPLHLLGLYPPFTVDMHIYFSSLRDMDTEDVSFPFSLSFLESTHLKRLSAAFIGPKLRSPSHLNFSIESFIPLGTGSVVERSFPSLRMW